MPASRDHRSAVGMADQDRRPVLQVEHVVRGLDIALERQRLVLHDAHFEAVRGQHVVYTPPARAVDETTVDENDVAHISHG